MASCVDENERRKALVASVETLSQTEVEEIFKMVHEHGCNYTRNNNGVFLNLAWIEEALLTKLEQYIEFCKKSRIEITKYESLCDVLNQKLYVKDHQETTEALEVNGNRRLINKGFVTGYDDSDLSDDARKLSSSAKYMMFKKKFGKCVVFTPLDNELNEESVVIEN